MIFNEIKCRVNTSLGLMGAVAILEWKKWGSHCGAKEKSGGQQQKYLSCMAIFHCVED